MSDRIVSASDANEQAPTERWGGMMVLVALIPLLLLGGLITVLVVTGAGLGKRSAPPIEELTINRITLPEPHQIVMTVTNGGADPVTIAQIQVDDAYWVFDIQPSATIPRLGSATIQINYPWVQDEAHAIKLLSSNGVPFEGEIPIATQTPTMTAQVLWQYGLIGLYVGFIPVGLGLLWFPFLRRLGRGGMQAVLSLTVGLLVFLLFDMSAEAFDIIGDAPAVFGGAPLVIIVGLLGFLALVGLGQTPKRGISEARLGLAYRIALGIGLHNLGEGLAIGAAFASGSMPLGTFLIVGFTLHNITEGIGIAAPIAREQPRWWHFVVLAALAGLPAILGIWIGGFSYSALTTAIFLAVGAGAIAQVIYEVGRLILRQQSDDAPALSWATLGGLVAGMGLMYLTALFVAA